MFSSVAFYIRRSYLTGQLNGASGENIVDEIDSLKQLHRIVAQE
jgi:hypothetical protein